MVMGIMCILLRKAPYLVVARQSSRNFQFGRGRHEVVWLFACRF